MVAPMPIATPARAAVPRLTGAIRWGSIGLLVAGFIMWGGVGAFDSPTAPQIGALRLQDVLAGLSALLLIPPILMRKRWPPALLAAMVGPVFLLGWGSVVGLVGSNGLRNVAAEARPLVFEIVGVALGAYVGSIRVERMLHRFAVVVAGALLVQFAILVVAPGLPTFVSGAGTGNIFTLGVPIVRPAGGFHLVGAAFVAAALRYVDDRRRLGLGLLGLGIVVTQSKTYWLIMIATGMYVVFSGPGGRALLRRTAQALLALVLLGGAAAVAGVLGNGSAGLSTPFEKFSLVIENPAVANAVLSKRTEELGMMSRAMHGSSRNWLLGRGLGYVYRDQGALYFREDPRDRARLAMFGHDYPMWLFVKGGIFGFLAVFLPIVWLLRRTWQTSTSHRRLIAVCVALLVSSLVLGSLEMVPGALAMGLVLGSLTHNAQGID